MFRLIDANLNRAREALRVLEDISRFVLNNGQAASRLKSIRHSLSQVFQPLARRLLEARDVAGDQQKSDRRARPSGDLDGLVAANFKRAQEALRSLEEAATIVAPSVHAAIMKLRFQTYELESDLFRRRQLLARLEDARLYVILDPDLCRTSPEQACRKILRGGADIIQLRAPGFSDRRLFRLARKLRRIIEKALFIVNDRPHVAAASRADGVHLGKTDLPIPDARKIVGRFAIVGATTHNAAEARAAQALGADYLSYGPVFATPIKPGLKPAGFSYLEEIKKLGLPFFPIGGINAENAGRLAARGIRRAAVCSAILKAPDPEAAARLIRRRISS